MQTAKVQIRCASITLQVSVSKLLRFYLLFVSSFFQFYRAPDEALIAKTAVWLIFFLITVKPALSDHIKQDRFWAFQTDGCLLLHERSAESLQELSALLSFRG